MSQHDYDIANAPGASVRADLNAVLAAIATHNSGSSAPPVTFPHMMWFDTSTNILKIRNDANTAWLSMANITTTLFTPYRQGVALGDAATRTIGVGASNQVPDRAAADTRWLSKVASDTSVGNLTIAKSGPMIVLNDNAASPTLCILRYERDGVARWHVYKNTTDQNFHIGRRDEGGSPLDVPINISFSTGAVTFSAIPIGPNADPTANNQLARKLYVDNRVKYYQSGLVNWTSGGTVNFAHGLGVTPFLVWPVAHCLTSEHGYTGGVSQVVLSAADDNSGMPLPGTIRVDSTNIVVRFGTPSPSTVMAVVNHATTGARVALTSTNWQLRYHAVAFAL